MTEPQGGSDPTVFITRAELDGDEWVINGEKWFSSNARFAVVPHRAWRSPTPTTRRTSGCRCSSSRPTRRASTSSATSAVGGRARRTTAPTPTSATTTCACPADHLLGGAGDGFVVAQTRLGGGRIHHAMRTVGTGPAGVRHDVRAGACRATRRASCSARKQLVQEMIADSWIEIEQFRLLVLRTAWLIDKYNDYKRVRADIAAVKAAMPKVLHDVASRALQVHGSLGVSNEMPFGRHGPRVVPHGPRRRPDRGAQGDAGPAAAARRTHRPPGLFPTGHLPSRPPMPGRGTPSSSSWRIRSEPLTRRGPPAERPAPRF